MGAGSKVMIASGDDIRELALVVDGRLLVSTQGGGGGGPTADVNITAVGGVAVGTTVPVSGTVSVTQSTTPWVVGDGGGSLTVDDGGASITVDGTVTVNQGTSPWVIGDGGGSITVDGTVAVSAIAGTVAVTQSTTPWVIGDGGASITVDGTVTVTQGTSPWVVSGAVDAHLDGTVDAGNSSTTPLGGGATFTGSFVEVTDYALVTVTIFADVASATEGMLLQWSGDGTNVDRQEAITIAAGAAGGRAMSLNVRGRFFRVVYTNGGAAQAVFRLGTVLHPVGTGLNNVVIDETIPATALAILTRSVITGETTAGGGAYVNVKVTPSGAVSVDGSVAVSAVVPGTGATNLGKAEDAIHTSGDVGVMALAVRNDAGTALAANGDYIPLQTDSVGSLRVNAGTVTVSGPLAVRLQDGGGADLVNVKQDSAPVGAGAAAVLAASMVMSPTAGGNGTHTINDQVFLRSDPAGNLLTSAFLMDPVNPLTNVCNVPGDLDSSGDLLSWKGIAPMFEVGAPDTNLGDATWNHAFISTDGRIQVETTGSVTVLSVVPGTTATNLGKAEDAVHNSGDVGVMALAVRADTAAASAANGDYIPLIVDSTGRLHVNVGTVVPGTGATNLGKAEDAVHTTGDTGVMPLAVRQDTLAVLAAAGDYIPFVTDAVGRLRVYNESGKRTYRAATTNNYAQVTSSTMFFVIGGSSTQTIRVQRIVVSGMSMTDIAYQSLVVEKWSTAPTGGTSSALTKVPLDASDAAATATLVQTYSVAPTEGTLVGTIACRRLLVQDDTAAASAWPLEWVFDFRNVGEAGPVVLRGTAQCLSLAFGASPASTITLAIEIEWTEEA